MSNVEPFVATVEESPPLRVIGETIRTLASAERTAGLEVFVQEGPAGVGPPPHAHPWEEAFFVIEGQVDVSIGARLVALVPGGFAFVPAGVEHGFRFRSAARLLSMCTRGGAARFFGELDRDLGGAVDLPRILAIAGRHAIAIAAPGAGE